MAVQTHIHGMSQPQHNEAVQRLARFGYLTKGVLYVIVGGLALSAAFGTGGQLTDGKGAVRTIAQQPFGQVLLVLTAIGLGGYALWRLIEVFIGSEETGAKDKVKRLGYLASAAAHGALMVAAIQMATGSGASGGGQKTWLGSLFAAPGGQVIGMLLGAFVVGYGVYEITKGVKGSFEKQLRLGEMSATQRTWICRAARGGLAARGVVFGLMGVFVIQASMSANPQEAKGLGGALAEVASQPFGQILLVLVAAGLVLYGAYMMASARFRRIV